MTAIVIVLLNMYTRGIHHSGVTVQRRDFLANLPAAGPVAGFSSPFPSATGTADSQKKENITEKVKRSMLFIQRAACEQGVAMRSLLEPGESDLVILMALRATKGGRPPQ